MKIAKKPRTEAAQTLEKIFGFSTNQNPYFKIGDLIDQQDDWGPGMIYDHVLDQDANEWKYRISFPKMKCEKWYYEKKIRYFLHINEIKIFKA